MTLTRRALLERIGAVGGAGAAYLAMETLGLAMPTPARAEQFALVPDSGRGRSAAVGISGGLAWTDRLNENVIYPSAGFGQAKGVLVAAYNAGGGVRGSGYAELLRPEGPIVFAGEHLSYQPTWKEGAVLSAHEALRRVAPMKRAKRA